MKPTKLAIDPVVFPGLFLFWFGPWNDAGVRKFCRDERLWNGRGDFPRGPSGADGKCYFFGSGSLIWMPHPPKFARQIGTLSHECVHAVQHHGETLGFTLSKDSDEYYAYMVGFLVTRVLQEFHK